MATIGKLIVDLLANTSKFIENIEGAEKKFKKTGAEMQKTGKTLTASISLPLAGVAAASIKFASDLDESMSKTRVVFGASSKAVEAFATTAAVNLGLSERAALESTATFGNLFTTMGMGQSAAAGMSTDLVKLAADLASFNNLNTADVLEKLRSGLVGQTEPLRALGVNLTEAAVKAKAMELGLADAGGQLSEAAKLQARYALILEQTTTAQGDFARTSDGLANSTRVTMAEMENAAAALGELLLPYARDAVKTVGSLVKIFTDLDAPTRNAAVAIGALAFAAGPALTAMGKLSVVIAGLPALLTSIGSGIAAWKAGLSVTTALQVAFGATAVTVGAVVIALAALVAAGYAVYKMYQTVEQGTKQVNAAWTKFFEDEAAAGKDAAQIQADYANKVAEVNRVREEGGLIAKVFVKDQEGITRNTQGLADALSKASKTYEEYSSAMEDAGISQMALTREQFEAAHAANQLADAAGESSEQVAEAAQQASQAVNQWKTAVARAQDVSSAASQQYNTYASMASAAATADREAAAAAQEHSAALEAQANILAETAENLSFALEGPIASAWENYSQTVADIQKRQQDLDAEFNTAYEQTLPEYQSAIEENNAVLGKAKEAFAENTKEILYNRVAASLDAEAALNLARQWGLISETDFNVAKATQEITKAFDENKDGLIDAGEASKGFYDALNDVAKAAEDGTVISQELYDILRKLDGMHVSATVDVTNNYTPIDVGGPPPVGGGGNAGGGGSGSGPNVQEQAAGGDYWVTQPTLFLVGEAEPERATFTPQSKGGANDSRGGDTYHVYLNDQMATAMWLEQKRRAKIDSLEAGM